MATFEVAEAVGTVLIGTSLRFGSVVPTPNFVVPSLRGSPSAASNAVVFVASILSEAIYVTNFASTQPTTVLHDQHSFRSKPITAVSLLNLLRSAFIDHASTSFTPSSLFRDTLFLGLHLFSADTAPPVLPSPAT